MDEDVRVRILDGKGVTAAEYIQILEDRCLAQAEYKAAMQGFDAILTPTVPMAAKPVADADPLESPAQFTRPINYLGMCALSIPTGLTSDGLPTSLQIAARGGDESTVLRVGAALEANQTKPNWPDLG
ncbi:MAG: amidase family protein [Geminicoccaceae bacterium]